MVTGVTITYLELDLAGARGPAPAWPDGVRLERAVVPQPELNRFLYCAVGGAWYWTDRLPWTYAEWSREIARDGYETWLLFERGSIAGYFELAPGEDGAIEIAYFGLLPQFVGRGFGRPLLEAAVARCGALGARRVTVNTCTLDHEAALANYRARGFTVVRTVTVRKELPAASPGPWSGA